MDTPYTHVLYLMVANKGNPGKAGAGFAIYKNDEEIAYKSIYVGDKETNNKAEYMDYLKDSIITYKQTFNVFM